MALEEGAYMLLTKCPPSILSLENGLELMRESGEPMECGIFDFYKVFSRAFGEEEDGAGGSWSGRWGNVVNDAGLEIHGIERMLEVLILTFRRSNEYSYYFS